VNINCSGLASERIYLTSNSTLTLLDGTDGQVITLIITQDSTGGRSLTFENASGTPSIAQGANASTIMQLVYDQVTNTWIVPATAVTGGIESANTVYAGPATGAPAIPTFRALTAADLPPGVLSSVSVTFTAAQIIAAAGGTPQTILAGIAGKVIVPFGLTLEYKFGSAAFVVTDSGGITGGFAEDIANGGGILGVLSTGFIDQTVSQYFTSSGLTSNGPLSDYVDEPLILGANPAGGSLSGGTGGEIVVTVYYLTITPA
jgi:hypothetical protein